MLYRHGNVAIMERLIARLITHLTFTDDKLLEEDELNFDPDKEEEEEQGQPESTICLYSNNMKYCPHYRSLGH